MVYRDMDKKRVKDSAYWQNNTKSPNPNGFRISIETKSKPFSLERRRYETCQHYFYRDRQLVQCGVPTENGRPTCTACARIEALGPRQARRDTPTTYAF